MTKYTRVDGKKARGRPKKRWFEVVVQRDMRMTGVVRRMPRIVSKWRLWTTWADLK